MKRYLLPIVSAAMIIGATSSAFAQSATYFPGRPTKQTDQAAGNGYGYGYPGYGGYRMRGFYRGYDGYRGGYGYDRYGY
jgi:hypothetical protein